MNYVFYLSFLFYSIELFALSVDLNSMQFMNPHPYGFHRVYQDSTTHHSPYPQPEWTPTVSQPVLFPRNATVNVYLNVTVMPSNYSGPLYIYGSGDQSFLGAYSLSQGGQMSLPIASSSNVPSTTGYHPNWSITWSFNTDPQDPFATVMDTTINPLYVTLDAPTGDAVLYRSVAHIACAGVAASNSIDLVNGIWNKFANAGGVSTYYQADLKYYEQGYTFGSHATTVGGLITGSKRGQCGSFVQLFMYALKLHGISGMAYSVLNPAGHYMLIHHMYPAQSSSGDPQYPYWVVSHLTDGPEMQPAGTSHWYGDLYSIGGIAGQNTSMPGEKWFGVHFIYKVAGTYYDPSYGKTYSNSSDFITQALFGVTTPIINNYANARLSMSGDVVFW